MQIDSSALARELRRRHLGSPGLHHGLEAAQRSTWVPGDLGQVPSGLLVLAAVSLVRGRRRDAGPPGPGPG